MHTVNGISKPPICTPTSSPSTAPSSFGDTAVPSMSPSSIPSAAPSVNETCLFIRLQKYCNSRDWSGAVFSLSGPNDYYVSYGVTVNSPVLTRIWECPKAEGLYALTVYMNSSMDFIPQSVYSSVSCIYGYIWSMQRKRKLCTKSIKSFLF